MIREYRTIEEVAGPLMLVRQVEGVKYDELGEIELPDGEVRRCRVLEVDGKNVLVQLFESAAGINLANSKVRFSGHGVELPFPAICWDGFSTAWVSRLTAAPASFPKRTWISTARRSTRRRGTIHPNSSRPAFPVSTV